MNTLIFKSGKEIECLSVIGASKYVKGANRDCLTFNFNGNDITANEVMSLFSDKEETAEITVCRERNTPQTNLNGDTNGFLYSDYTLFAGLEIKNETIRQETNTQPEETITMISVTIGQLSYSEKLEAERIKQLEILLEISADMLGGAL